MNNQHFYLDDRLVTTVAKDCLGELIKNEMEFNCIETYAYLRMSNNNQSAKLISTYPKQWLDIYLKKQYYYYDPVVQKAKYKISPFAWNKDGGEYHNIFQESKEYSILHGVCFVAHRSDGVFSLFSICNTNSSKDFFKELREKEDKIQMILLKCFEEDITSEHEESYNIKLTSREREVLKWLGLGKTYYETSIICNISERTVRFHLVNILKKLNVNNTKYALTKAAIYGLLDK
jgi:LuxR family quorum-sensing system transcriptional regulator ExpR